MKKLNKKTGFTLAELLIVVAIIAILVAIGIPAFSTAMERSRETVDLSNIRGAYAEFMAGTLGGAANTGYYKVNIKQRDVTNWIIDTNGFLTNIVEYDSTGKKYVTPTQMPDKDQGLANGDIWVRFTTKEGSTTTTTGEGDGATSTTTPNPTTEKPMLTFVANTADGKPTVPTGSSMDFGKAYNPNGGSSAVTTNCVVAPLTDADTPTVNTETDWYLTIE